MPISFSQPIATANIDYSSFPEAGSKKPKKYVKIDGITQLNPEYKKWQAEQGKPATTAKNPEKALPVVTNMDDHQELREASMDAGYGDVALSDSTAATVDIIQEDDVCEAVGLDCDDLMDGIGEIFAKYEAPIGLMNKLMDLSEYDQMEFIIDDSGSMRNHSDTTDAHGRIQTRWEEAKVRLKSMLEVAAYVPTPPMSIRFLNRGDCINLRRNGETPQQFLNSAYNQIDRVFNSLPTGSTPAKERLEQSLTRGAGKRWIRYFFGDGVPNGGKNAIKAITKLVTKRNDPQGNPLTFMSCTNQDDEVEWMKEVEEIAPYCAEYDDFNDEADEVRRDQGDALPYTKGFHLIGQLVGAMNPDDLDAMDESVPFTKFMLESLLGVKCEDKEFRHYFDCFLEAQTNRKIDSKMDKVKKNFDWASHYNAFLSTRMTKDISAVKDFKKKIKKAN